MSSVLEDVEDHLLAKHRDACDEPV